MIRPDIFGSSKLTAMESQLLTPHQSLLQVSVRMVSDKSWLTLPTVANQQANLLNSYLFPWGVFGNMLCPRPQGFSFPLQFGQNPQMANNSTPPKISPTKRGKMSGSNGFSVDNLLSPSSETEHSAKHSRDVKRLDTPDRTKTIASLNLYQNNHDITSCDQYQLWYDNVCNQESQSLANQLQSCKTLSQLQIPKEFTLLHLNMMGTFVVGVYCKFGETVEKGTHFEYPLDEKEILIWYRFARTASKFIDANLHVVEKSAKLLAMEATKDIQAGEEILIYHVVDIKPKQNLLSPSVSTSTDTNDNPISPVDPSDQTDANGGFQCDRCGKVFSYKYYRDKHLKYTRCVDNGDRKFPCHLCSRSFEKRDRLRIHILHVHEKHRPHLCTICGKSFSQSSSLNKHLRVHSGERPYKCVYCGKAFTASSILRTHIRQHSGEKPFKCKFCGKAFASHAAHDSHVRRTHVTQKLDANVCRFCDKSFQHSSHLKFHLQCVHSSERQPTTDEIELKTEAEPHE